MAAIAAATMFTLLAGAASSFASFIAYDDRDDFLDDLAAEGMLATVESFATKVDQIGGREAISILLQSVLVIVVAYAVMSSFLLQTIVFGFPETLLAVGAAYVALGRYVGLRLVEYSRFRWLWVG